MGYPLISQPRLQLHLTPNQQLLVPRQMMGFNQVQGQVQMMGLRQAQPQLQHINLIQLQAQMEVLVQAYLQWQLQMIVQGSHDWNCDYNCIHLLPKLLLSCQSQNTLGLALVKFQTFETETQEHVLVRPQIKYKELVP